MSDMKFGLIFEVRGMDAARKELEWLKNGQREIANQKEAQANAGQKATEAARREIEANKELARTKAVQNELARVESARAERDLRRRAAAERGLSADLRRARALEIAETRRQIQAEEVKRVAQAKAEREQRLRYLERRRLIQAEENARIQAERSVEAERRRADERIAASISKRTGRPIQEIVNEMNRAGQAAETAGMKAARAESRWRRLGEAMRNTRWGRVAGAATAELSKSIAKSVVDGIGRGLKEAASSARVSNIMGTGGRVSAGGGFAQATKELTLNTFMGSVSDNQAGFNTKNQLIGPFTAEQANSAVAAATAAHAETGRRTPLTEYLDAARELTTGIGAAPEKGLIKDLADAAFAKGFGVTDIAKEYADAVRRKDIASFAERMGATVASDESGRQVLSYKKGGQEIARPITPGSEAAIIRELIGVHSGAIARYGATPQGMWDTAATQARANAAAAMEEPFRKATEWMQRLNEAMAGFDGGAAGFGKKIAEGMDLAEKGVLKTASAIKAMNGFVDRLVETTPPVLGGGLRYGPAREPNAAEIRAGASGRVLGEIIKQSLPPPQPAPRPSQGLIGGPGWPRLVEPPMPDLGGPAGEIRAGLSSPMRPGLAGPAAEALALTAQVPPAAQQAATQAQMIFRETNLHGQGVAMMETLAAGIRAGSGAVTGAVREVTQAMRDYLPHSPAKVGPLSDLDRVRFSETLAIAIRPAPAVAAVSAVAAGMLGALPAAAALPVRAADVPMVSRPGGGGIHISYKPQLSLPEGSSRGDFEQLLEEHSRKLVQLVEDAAKRADELKFK